MKIRQFVQLSAYAQKSYNLEQPNCVPTNECPKTCHVTHFPKWQHVPPHVESSMASFRNDLGLRSGRGVITSWGANSHGQLGNGNTDDVRSPTVNNISFRPKTITGGGGHTLIISDTGQLFSCGWNNKGQLGIASVDSENIYHPHLVDFFNNTRLRSVAGGWDHSILCTENGDVYTWGSNAFGQLGCPSIKGSTKTPMKVHLCDKVVAVAAGLRHSLALADSGKLYAWGSGKKGQLGVIQDGRPPAVLLEPHQVVCLPYDSMAVKDLACGAYHSAVLTESGAVYVWGNNKHGQMALPSAQQISVLSPRQVTGLPGHVIRIYSGWTHLLALIDSGEVVSWGRNDLGQLGRASGGDGATDGNSAPRPALVKRLQDITHIACGSEHNLALTADGDVLSWGWNEHGICGTGDEVDVLTPHQIAGLRDLRTDVIGCGNGHSFACSRPR